MNPSVSKYLLDQDFYTLHEREINSYSVVCLLFIENEAILIKRSQTVPTHKNQLGLIGGHVKNGETFKECLVREIKEELGELKNSIEILGTLNVVETTDSVKILPFVGRIRIKRELFLSLVKGNGEWVNIFLVPIVDLYNIKNWYYGNLHFFDSKPIFFFPLKVYKYTKLFEEEERTLTLWGATSLIVLDFAKKVPFEFFMEKNND